MQPKKVKKIKAKLTDNGLSSLDTLVVEINSSSMNGSYTKFGNTIEQAKKGKKLVYDKKKLKSGKEIKDWVFKKVKNFNWETIDNVLFMVNHSQSEEHKEAFHYPQTNSNGDIIEEAYKTNFKTYLENFGFDKKIVFEDLPLYTKDLK